MFDLTGKKAVVIGGAGGIGQALAEGLAVFGAEVLIASRSEERLQNAVKEIKESSGLDVIYHTVDAADEASIIELKDYALEKMGRVDILVNSQGINIKHPVMEFPVEEWDEMYGINVRGLMLTCRTFGKYMIENKYGKIVNVSSVRAERACFGMNTGYGSTKGAVKLLTQGLAADFGPYVTVNAIGPAITETPMMTKFFETHPGYKEGVAETLPLKRIGLTEDLVGACVYLCSDASAFVTGQSIYPDGGLTIMG